MRGRRKAPNSFYALPFTKPVQIGNSFCRHRVVFIQLFGVGLFRVCVGQIKPGQVWLDTFGALGYSGFSGIEFFGQHL